MVDDPDLARDIASLVSDVAIKLDLSDEEIPRVWNLEEVRMSLLQRADKWTQQWMAEGETKGMAKALKNQVARRFGNLPAWAIDRIDRADVDILERWLYLVLDATALDDVFQVGEPAQQS